MWPRSGGEGAQPEARAAPAPAPCRKMQREFGRAAWLRYRAAARRGSDQGAEYVAPVASPLTTRPLRPQTGTEHTT